MGVSDLRVSAIRTVVFKVAVHDVDRIYSVDQIEADEVPSEVALQHVIDPALPRPQRVFVCWSESQSVATGCLLGGLGPLRIPVIGSIDSTQHSTAELFYARLHGPRTEQFSR